MEYETIKRVDGPDDVLDVGPAEHPASWWQTYAACLAEHNVTETARQVIELDSEYLTSMGVFGAGEPGEGGSTWPATRLRRGLAMGSVQSGKTSSMLAVTAKSLDRGVDIVVVLGGTRLALWRQTYDRVIQQLDGWSQSEDSRRRASRVLVPSPQVLEASAPVPDLSDLYFETPNLVRRMLAERRPLIAVVMKHSDHLMSFRKYIHDVLKDVLLKAKRPLHMLVIDDEADDGSILDKEVEAGLTPDSDGLKQIPRHIARLWSDRCVPFETCHAKLFATYLAYTATPQSNFLQSDHNPLSPSDFVVTLRVPSDHGAIGPPRSTTFAEPAGVSKYYIGGAMLYRTMAEEPGAVCIAAKFPDRETFRDESKFEAKVCEKRSSLLSEALRAYFVAGAIRLLLSGRSLAQAKSAGPASEEAILRLCPDPHSMLYHPSSRIDDHFLAATEIVDWSKEFDSSWTKRNEATQHADVVQALSSSGLIARLTTEDDLWKRWLTAYEGSRHRLSYLPGGHVFAEVSESQWPEIRRILINDVFPNTRLTVINSDPRADDRPSFVPARVGSGQFTAPRDIYTIFVSGNVMARGVTLEGLTTTLFLRSSIDPLADTQMQMQRWFGYRGKHLCWCRVFLFEDQLNLFRAYHEADEALRSEIIQEMNQDPGSAPGPLVLQGHRYKATGKIANLRTLPLCPGADPFVRVIESKTFVCHNANVLVSLLETEQWHEVVVGDRARGQIMNRQLGLVQAAELLELFRYSKHNPNPAALIHDRWRALASQLALPPDEAPLFRPPSTDQVDIEAVPPHCCPYSIAAYLRLWNAVLSRRASGLYPTDNPATPWSMINLEAYRQSAPKFYVGVRYGTAGLSSDKRLASFGVQSMIRKAKDGVLRSTWGSRNPGEEAGTYLGDQLFDYHVHGGTPPQQAQGEPLWRPRGAPGLVLFHVIADETNKSDVVTVGVAIPSGGPDHIAALRAASGKQHAN